MSDSFKFDIDDVGSDADTESNDDSSVSEGVKDGFSFTALTLLPLTILSVYAFLEKAVVVAALTSMFGGASGLAVAVGTTAWLVGGIVVGVLGLLAFLTVVALLAGVVKQSGAELLIGTLGVLYFAAGYAGATYLFAEVPLLVGFMLTTTLISWGAVLVIGSFVMVGALIIM